MKWMMCIGVVAMLAGCDASKDELESTKTTLASVSKERDDLKTQVSTLQQQLDATKAELAKAKAPAAASASTATKTPDGKDGTVAKGKHSHKS